MSQLEIDLAAGLHLIEKRYVKGQYFGGKGGERVCSVGAAVKAVMGERPDGGNHDINRPGDGLVFTNKRIIDVLWHLAVAIPYEYQVAARADGIEYIHDFIENYNDKTNKKTTIAMWRTALDAERDRIASRQKQIDELKKVLLVDESKLVACKDEPVDA